MDKRFQALWDNSAWQRYNVIDTQGGGLIAFTPGLVEATKIANVGNRAEECRLLLGAADAVLTTNGHTVCAGAGGWSYHEHALDSYQRMQVRWIGDAHRTNFPV